MSPGPVDSPVLSAAQVPAARALPKGAEEAREKKRNRVAKEAKLKAEQKAEEKRR